MVSESLKDPSVTVHIINETNFTKFHISYNSKSNKLFYSEDILNILTEDEMISLLVYEYVYNKYSKKRTDSIITMSIAISKIVNLVGATTTSGLGTVLKKMISVFRLSNEGILHNNKYKSEKKIRSMIESLGYAKDVSSALVKLKEYNYNHFSANVCKFMGFSNSGDCKKFFNEVQKKKQAAKDVKKINNLLDKTEKVLKLGPKYAIGFLSKVSNSMNKDNETIV